MAFGQDWATRAYCTVEQPWLDPALFAYPSLETMQEEAATIPNGRGKFWRITAPTGAVSHLWGTMHSNDPMILALPFEVERAIKNARLVMPEFDFRMPSRAAIETLYRWEDIYLSTTPDAIAIGDLDVDPQILDWIRIRLESIGWGRDAPELYRADALVEVVLEDPCNDFALGSMPIQDGRIVMLGLVSGAEVKGLEPVTALKDAMRGSDGAALMEAMLTIYGVGLAPPIDNRARVASFALYLNGESALWALWHEKGVRQYFGWMRGRRLLRTVNDFLIDGRNETFVNSARSELHRGGVFLAGRPGASAGRKGHDRTAAQPWLHRGPRPAAG